MNEVKLNARLTLIQLMVFCPHNQYWINEIKSLLRKTG